MTTTTTPTVALPVRATDAYGRAVRLDVLTAIRNE